ncbi:MAG: ankyrin repeat domain-containing protein, partial [Burkholderiaceae bacterium]
MALLFLKEIFVMIPSSLGISSQESASSTPSDDTEVSRTPTTPQQPTSPRMVQRSPEAEQDGMEVDNPEDEKDRIQDHRRPPKRSREDNESEHVTHSEPKLKRQRRSVDASPAPSEPDQQPAYSSSSSSSTSSFPSISSSSLTHATVTASSTMSASAGPAKLICNALGENDALEVVTIFGPDQKKATALLFGETVIEWPDGYSLLQVGPPSPALAELLTECGVQVLWQGLTQREKSQALLLITPESDRERLKSGLMGMPLDAPAEELAQANGDHVDSDDDDEEEFRQFPTRKHSTPLMLAAAIGDAETVAALLHQGADPNQRDPSDATALMIAAGHNHIRAVRALLRDHRTKVHLNNSMGADALCHAAAQGDIQMFSLLLGFGGATLSRERVRHDRHPLFIAARKGHYPICEMI